MLDVLAMVPSPLIRLMTFTANNGRMGIVTPMEILKA